MLRFRILVARWRRRQLVLLLFHAVELHELELFPLFLGENLVQALDAIDSVVEQCFLSLENVFLGGCDFGIVIIVEGIAERFLGVLLLLAKNLERRIHHTALLFQCGFLLVGDLQNRIHECGALFWIELLVERLSVLERLAFFKLLVVLEVIEARIARRFATEMFAMEARPIAEFAMTLAAVHFLFAAVAFFEFACSLLRTAGYSLAGT